MRAADLTPDWIRRTVAVHRGEPHSVIRGRLEMVHSPAPNGYIRLDITLPGWVVAEPFAVSPDTAIDVPADTTITDPDNPFLRGAQHGRHRPADPPHRARTPARRSAD